MQLEQSELEQIDSELEPLRNDKGHIGVKSYLSWMQMRGALVLSEKDYPMVTDKIEDGKFLYTILQDKLEVYSKWRRNGKKLDNLGNFGIKNDNPSKKSEDKVNAAQGTDTGYDFEKDVPF